METRIHPNGELEVIEYGQRTVYNMNGDIIYRVEGNIIEEVEYGPTGELEIYKIKVGNLKYQYDHRGECVRMHYGKMDETIDNLKEYCMYKLRTDGGQYRYEYRGVYLDWEFRMEEQERCPNYYDNLNSIF